MMVYGEAPTVPPGRSVAAQSYNPTVAHAPFWPTPKPPRQPSEPVPAVVVRFVPVAATLPLAFIVAGPMNSTVPPTVAVRAPSVFVSAFAPFTFRLITLPPGFNAVLAKL